jgi:signal transduction histidine kinase
MPGDRIRRISYEEGGINWQVDSLTSIRKVLSGAPSRVLVGVERGGTFLESPVDLVVTPRAERVKQVAAVAAGSALFFYLPGMLLIRSRSRAPVALLVLCSCVSAVTIASSVGQSNTLLQILGIVMLCLMPAALFHLGLTFPDERPLVGSRPGVLGVPYIVVAPLALVGAWSVTEVPDVWIAIPPILVGLLSASWLWIGLSCWFALKESPVGIARARARVLLVGAVASCGIFLIGAQFFSVPSPLLFALSGAPLMLPLPVGLAISRYNLFSLPFDTRRSVASGLMAATYAASVLAVTSVAFGPFDGRLSGELFAICFFVFVALESGRQRMDSSVRGVLLRRATDLHEVAERFVVELAEISEERAVCQFGVATASKGLEGASCAIHLRKSEGLVCLAAAGSGWVAHRDVAQASSEMLEPESQLLHLGYLSETLAEGERELLSKSIEIICPIRHGPEDMGLFVVGRGVRGQSHSYEEEQFLLEIARTLAQALHGAELVEGLLQADRRATTGRVGLAIAHEVGKQLGSIDLLAEMALDNQTSEATALPEIKRVAEDGQAVLRKFIRDAKRPEWDETDFASVAEILDDTKRAASVGRSSATVLTRVDPSLARQGLPRIVVRALVGIVDNALNASSDGASVSVSFVRTPQGARIDVQDSGEGIAPEILPEIFRLGFSTRSEQGGQGVGLTIASEILKQLGAELGVLSEEGLGTTVSIDFPARLIAS